MILITFILFAIFAHLIFQIFLNSAKDGKPLLIWWTPFMPHSLRETDCFGGLQCLITGERNPEQFEDLAAYLFYGSRIENHDFPLPRNHSIVWAIYHEESPKNYAPFLFKNTQLLFNISATFSQNSNFPLTLNYLENFELLTNKTYFRDVLEKNSYLDHLAPVIYIQSDCDTPSNRDDFVKNLMQYIDIDSYGKCLTNRELPKNFRDINSLDYYNEHLMNLVSKYKFVIAFENALCSDYVTEKLWRPLMVGSVPIYLGSPSIEDWLPNENSAILANSFKDAKDLADYIKEINKNDTLYNQFLEHKTRGIIKNRNLTEKIESLNTFHTGHSITEFECFICQKVHEKKQTYGKSTIYDCPKPKKSDWSQHWDIGQCQTKALNMLMERNLPFSKETFNTLWNKLKLEKNCDIE